MADKKPNYKEWIFQIVMLLIVVLSIGKIALYGWRHLEFKYRPLIVQAIASNMSPEEREKVRNEISKTTMALWETVPEPLVGRIAKPNSTSIQSLANVHINNSGMRDARPYKSKSPETFRIVCLGDSFVFGEAGREEDRWCTQLEQWFKDNAVLVDNKKVEALSLGLSSWTMLQEATYLSSRLTAYDPDLIIVLTVTNDITDDSGITGSGLLTNDYSTSNRSWGSGTIVNTAAVPFGLATYTALMYDGAPTARQYWENSFIALKRLADLQQKRNKSILFSVMGESPKEKNYFENIYAAYYEKSGIKSPMIAVTYARDKETMLAHDSHPNRHGHELLMSQYIHALQQAGIITAPAAALPVLDNELIPSLNKWDFEKSLVKQRIQMENQFVQEIDFVNFNKDLSASFLGGIFPNSRSDFNMPWASVRAGLILKQASPPKNKLAVDIDIPDRAELFPLQIKIRVNKSVEKTLTFNEKGKETLLVDLPHEITKLPAIEIMFEANHYFTEIDDHRMKCFRLLHIGLK